MVQIAFGRMREAYTADSAQISPRLGRDRSSDKSLEV